MKAEAEAPEGKHVQDEDLHLDCVWQCHIHMGSDPGPRKVHALWAP